MTVGERVMTPRFCTVKIDSVFNSVKEARENGFTEPTHYHKDGYTILGKSTSVNHMVFAAAKE